MELTELYLRGFMRTHGKDEEENLIQQILEDQEIIKELKKQIEEKLELQKKTKQSIYALEELQKIMEKKNGTN